MKIIAFVCLQFYFVVWEGIEINLCTNLCQRFHISVLAFHLSYSAYWTLPLKQPVEVLQSRTTEIYIKKKMPKLLCAQFPGTCGCGTKNKSPDVPDFSLCDTSTFPEICHFWTHIYWPGYSKTEDNSPSKINFTDVSF